MVTTGPSLLPENGSLAYNGVFFSILFRSSIRAEYLPDNAKRTTKCVAYTLEVEGVVTKEDGKNSVDDQVVGIRKLLSQPAGALTYIGRGFGAVNVNVAGNISDVAWGPIPKTLFFQPLGNGLSALVKWQCTFTVTEFPFSPGTDVGNVPGLPVLQFSYAYNLSYDEDCYSSISLRGILEVPLTRQGAGNRQIPPQVVDAFRQTWLNINFDLTKYRVVNRNFEESDDRRTCRWEFSVAELPPMDLPPGATHARGSMDVQPVKTPGQRGPLLTGVLWSCTLRCTYTIRKDFPRRQAGIEFFNLLQFRMNQSANGVWPGSDTQQQESPLERAFQRVLQQAQARANTGRPGQALLTDFRFHEGLFLDSKNITFEASWMLFTNFRTLMDASGVWRWTPDGQPQQVITGEFGTLFPVARQTWAASMANITGWRSWLANNIDPNSPVIVDMGGGTVGSNPVLPNQGLAPSIFGF